MSKCQACLNNGLRSGSGWKSNVREATQLHRGRLVCTDIKLWPHLPPPVTLSSVLRAITHCCHPSHWRLCGLTSCVENQMISLWDDRLIGLVCVKAERETDQQWLALGVIYSRVVYSSFHWQVNECSMKSDTDVWEIPFVSLPHSFCSIISIFFFHVLKYLVSQVKQDRWGCHLWTVFYWLC